VALETREYRSSSCGGRLSKIASSVVLGLHELRINYYGPHFETGILTESLCFTKDGSRLPGSSSIAGTSLMYVNTYPGPGRTSSRRQSPSDSVYRSVTSDCLPPPNDFLSRISEFASTVYQSICRVLSSCTREKQ
jgi:hypothetical protein